MEKKALSSVVATVLIVLITIAIGAMIAAFVVPFVRDNLKESSECLPYKDYFKFEEEVGDNTNYNCYYNDGGSGTTLIGASVKTIAGERSVPSDVSGFNIIFIKDNMNSVAVQYRPVSTIINRDTAGSTWMTKEPAAAGVIIPLPQEIISYSYRLGEAGANIQRAEIYPVLGSGRICEKSDEIMVKKCTIGVDLL